MEGHKWGRGGSGRWPEYAFRAGPTGLSKRGHLGMAGKVA